MALSTVADSIDRVSSIADSPEAHARILLPSWKLNTLHPRQADIAESLPDMLAEAACAGNAARMQPTRSSESSLFSCSEQENERHDTFLVAKVSKKKKKPKKKKKNEGLSAQTLPAQLSRTAFKQVSTSVQRPMEFLHSPSLRHDSSHTSNHVITAS